MKSIQTVRAIARGVEGLLLTGILSAMVVAFVLMLGAKMTAALEPLRAVLG